MTLETFFEKFDTFADSPDAVAKMRELVLRLATTGHLIPTDGSGWVEVPLNDIATARMGKTILKNELSTSGIPVYSAGRENTAWGLIAASDLTFRTGTIVVSARGTIGFPKIPAEPEFISTQTTIAITPTSAAIDSGYLCLQLQTVDWGALTAKTAIPMITVKQVHAIGVRYPHSLAEQKRIVAKVDELMALCDRLEAQQQERDTRHAELARASLARFAEAPTPANLHFLFHKSYPIPPSDLRKSILTLAVQGKLVPQDPQEGAGDEVLDALWKRNHENIEKCSSEDTNQDPLPFAIPTSWAVARLGQIYESSFYGPRFGKDEYVNEGGIPTIRTTDMTPGGQIILRDPPCVQINDPRKMALYAVRPNDLLVTRSGTIGMMAVFKGDYAAIPSAYLIRFRFPPEVMADFYYLFLGSPHGNDLLGLSLRSIGVPNVNATSISKFFAPIPPLAEQRRIVAKVDQLMALVDELETQLAACRATAKKLLDALVAELTT